MSKKFKNLLCTISIKNSLVQLKTTLYSISKEFSIKRTFSKIPEGLLWKHSQLLLEKSNIWKPLVLMIFFISLSRNFQREVFHSWLKYLTNVSCWHVILTNIKMASLYHFQNRTEIIQQAHWGHSSQMWQTYTMFSSIY